MLTDQDEVAPQTGSAGTGSRIELPQFEDFNGAHHSNNSNIMDALASLMRTDIEPVPEDEPPTDGK